METTDLAYHIVRINKHFGDLACITMIYDDYDTHVYDSDTHVYTCI